MKILIASDLHLEFYARQSANGLNGLEDAGVSIPLDPRVLESSDADVLVLAGDIITLWDRVSIDWLKDFTNSRFMRPVIYVLGNHEFYGSEFHKARQAAKQFFAGSNIYLLDNDTVEMGGVRFIGSTLWTDYQAAGNQMSSMEEADARLNDAQRISIQDDSRVRAFKAQHALAEHQIARAFIESELTKPFTGKTVVVTHHAPSITYGRHPDFGIDSLTGAFSSDLEMLFPSVDLWIWGHTHANIDTQVGRARLVSNQRGYPRETVPGGYDPMKSIEV